MKKANSVPYEETLTEDLADPVEAAAYLTECYEDSPMVFKLALRNVAKAHGGIPKLADRTGITREHLYTITSEEGNPTLDNLIDILKALDVNIQFVPASTTTAS